MSERRFLSRSEGATRALGAALGGRLGAGAVVSLDGELGAGKTVLVQGIARGLGVTAPVSSPTYLLMKEYSGRVPLYHFDAWMPGRERAFLEGGGDALLGGEGVCVVEWGSRVQDLLPLPMLVIELSHAGPSLRSIVLRVVDGGGGAEAYRDLLCALEPLLDLEELP